MIKRFKQTVPAANRPFAILVALNEFDGEETVRGFLLALQQDGRLTEEIGRFADDLRAGDRELNVSRADFEEARILVAEKSGDLAHDLDEVNPVKRAQLRGEYMIGHLLQAL